MEMVGVVSGEVGERRNERLGFNYIISILILYLKNRSEANMAKCEHLFHLAVDLWVSMTLLSLRLKCFIIKN